MKVIVTGGSGLIGRALTRRLVARGDEVTILSRNQRHVRDLPATARVAIWDAKTGRSWSELIDGQTAIVNLAGESIASGRWTAERKRRIRESRIQAGQAVAEAVNLAKERPPVVIQASAVGYYGPRGSEEVVEAAPPGSDFLARACVDWEQSSAAIEALGVRRVVIRTGVVFARDGGALPLMLLPFRFFAGGPLGSGRQQVPWIHLDDEVSAIVFFLDEESARGPYNLAASRPVDNAALSQIIGRVLRRPALLPTPAFILKIVLGEMATIVLDGQRTVPKRLEAAGFKFRYDDAEAALTAITRASP